ncbi:MAG: hypothetical protein E6G06_01700 [Actinobacteria bacterium]|nr:MAG: hypothetical protein E6G06_01700 [Actinomycetota bacterium]
MALLDRPLADVRLVGGRGRARPAARRHLCGEYVELVPHERIVFSFGWDPTEGAPAIAPCSTLVEITLTPEGDDTILALRHTGLPIGVRDEHHGGWGHFLAILATAAGGAVDD